MRVLLVSPTFYRVPCGIADYTRFLAQSLSDCGVEVTILTSPPVEGIAYGNDFDGYRVIREVLTWDSSALPGIVRSIQECRCDLIHIQYHTASFHFYPTIHGLPCQLILRKARTPVVTTFHDFAGPNLGKLFAPLSRLAVAALLLQSRKVIVTNERDQNRLKRLGVGAKRVSYVPVGATIPNPDREVDRERVRNHLGIRSDEIMALYFGFVDNIVGKGLDVLVEAVALVAENGVPLKMVMLGGTSLEARQALCQRVFALGIKESFLWLGYADPPTVSDILRSADFAVLPYADGVSERRTTFVATITHALPAVTTQREGIPSGLSDKENVLLVPVGNTRALANAIRLLAMDKDLRRRLSENVKKLRCRYDWKHIAEQTVKVYDRALGATQWGD